MIGEGRVGVLVCIVLEIEPVVLIGVGCIQVGMRLTLLETELYEGVDIGVGIGVGVLEAIGEMEVEGVWLSANEGEPDWVDNCGAI